MTDFGNADVNTLAALTASAFIGLNVSESFVLFSVGQVSLMAVGSQNFSLTQVCDVIMGPRV
jgi:hypothetical protein